MTLATIHAASSVLAQALISGSHSDSAARTLLTTSLALVAVGVVFIALRRVAQVVAALAAAAAAVGSAFLVVVVLLGLFATAVIFSIPL